MIVAPNWNIRHYIKFFRVDGEKNRYEARFDVFMYLVMSANQRLRCWPGIETIMDETGFQKAPVSEAIEWLEARGAIYTVPRDKRIGDEEKLHGNKKVWQLTGIMEIEGKIVEYLHLQPENKESIIAEIITHSSEDVAKMFAKLRSQGEPKQDTNKSFSSQNELNSHSDTHISSQDELEYAKLGSQNEPKLGSQNMPQDISIKEVLSTEFEVPSDSTPIPLSNLLTTLTTPARATTIDFETGEILSAPEKPKYSIPIIETPIEKAWELAHNQLVLTFKQDDLRVYVNSLEWLGLENGVGVIGVPTQVGKELCEAKVLRQLQNQMEGLGVKIERYSFKVMEEKLPIKTPELIHPDAHVNGAGKPKVNTVELMRQAREITDSTPGVRNKEAYATKIYQELLLKAGVA